MTASILLLLTASALPGAALVDAEDPARDDRGRGSYSYPTRPAYASRVFDLRRFRVSRDGEHLLFEVTFARPIVRPAEQARRSRILEIQLNNAVFVKHVDIYIETGEAGGAQQGLPGRNLAFERPWQRAVVLTPRPFLLESLLSQWRHGARVVVPSNLRAVGRTVRARIPLAELSDVDPSRWRFAVSVSGALWENRFEIYPNAPHDFTPNALTMPARPVADARWFGGGDLDGGQPNVIDLLAPTAEAQYSLLEKGRRGAPAVLPLSYGAPRR